ncbi:MAG: hypothetical protein ABIO32_03770 [Ferruginibacter sp.]
MSEEEKINLPVDDCQPSTENKNVAEPSTINHRLQTNEMEVHHHPDLNHKKKKFKEYFLEFLMIFLAVTMGFIAENLREHFTDKEKAKQSIKTIITAIASDTLQLNTIITSNKLSLQYLNKFIKLRGANLSVNQTKKQFYDDVANGSYNDVYFRSNDAAFQQLQTSGTLRLINKPGILDSLFQYQHNTEITLRLEADHYYFSKLVWEGMSKLIDVTYTVNSFNSENFSSEVYGSYKVPEGTDLAFNYDKITVNKIFNDASVLTLNTQLYLGTLNQQLVYGKKLIRLLKKEYHLENE